MFCSRRNVNMACDVDFISMSRNPDLSNRTVRKSNPVEHQSFDCRTQSHIIELTIKFCQSNTIERSITERLVMEPNGTFDYRTIGIIERSINERRIAHRMIGKWYWKIPKVKVKSPLTPFPFYAAFAEH